MKRTVLVTGASRGIGAAIARELAARAWGIVAAARTFDAVEALARELADAHGVPAAPLELDVADPEAVRKGVERARELAGDRPIEALVNNAGIAISAPLLSRAPEHEGLYERHMQVNFHGARRVAEALLPEMVERRRGTVVNLASSAGLRGYAYVAAYCASKHALVGWTRAAAAELESKGVGIHAVCPHYVDSPMLDQSVRRLTEKTGMSAEEARAFFAAQNPGGRLVTPEEVARSVAELLEADGTGRIVELDGGD